MRIAKTKKRARVGVAFLLALICVVSPVFVSTVSPAWAVSDWTLMGSDIDGEAIDSPGPNEGWGTSLSFSSNGSRIAIGAPSSLGAGFGGGQVRVYDLIGGAWTQVGGDINGTDDSNNLGFSVSLSADGSRVAIGAPHSDASGSFLAGQVRVYDLTGSVWVQVGGDINGEHANDRSGYSVSLSSDGSRVAIGAPHCSYDIGADGGHVRVFDLTGGAWVQVGSDINAEAASDCSGTAVSLSSDGSRVAIGDGSNDGAGPNAGHVRVYGLTGGAWVQLGRDIDSEAANDESGTSVSLSADGSRVAIGAVANDGNGYDSGHVRVYDLRAGAWVQVGRDIDGEYAYDYSGYSVSLSADGSRVAIGARGNIYRRDDAGQVRVYSLLPRRKWVQVGSDINGEVASDCCGQHWGQSVSLSSNGSRVAVGLIRVGPDAGHVRVLGYLDSGSGITSEPVDLKVKSKSPSTRTLEWAVPLSLNGASVTDYVIQYRVGGTIGWSTFTDGISTSRTATVTGLTKKVRYQFQVAARTAGGDSPYSTATKAS
jgi:hypothetical protein